jgi:hypothetical protein
MTKAATVHVPPGTLVWGRDRAKVELKDAADKIKRDALRSDPSSILGPK